MSKPKTLGDTMLDNIIFEIVFNDLTWSGYNKTVKLKNDYQTFFTGEGVEKHLRQIKKRESEEELTARIECTNFLNSSLYRKLKKNINKLSFLNTNITITSDDQALKTNLEEFYNNKDLKDYIFSCLVDNMLLDPNGLLFLGKTEDEGVNPLFVGSESIVYRESKRGVISFVALITVEGFRIYTDKKTYVFTETKDSGVQIESFEGVSKFPAIVTAEGKNFQIEQYDNSLIPFVSVGHEFDIINKTVYNSFFHSALSYFKKLTSIVSEYDITELKQAFPKIFAYETPCNDQSCNEGYDPNGNVCKTCNGTRVLTSKSGQDMITFPLPSNRNGEALQDLSKLYQEFKAPIETLNYQREVIREVIENALESIYGKESEAKVNETATGRLIELELTNQSLYPFANNIKRIFETSVNYVALLNGVTKNSTVFRFPQKLIELNESELLELIKLAKENNLPKSLISEYTNRLAQSVFKESTYKSKLYEINRELNPQPDSTLTDLLVMKDAGGLTKDDFILTVQFNNFVSLVAEDYLRANKDIREIDNSVIKVDLNNKLQDYKKNLETAIEFNIAD